MNARRGILLICGTYDYDGGLRSKIDLLARRFAPRYDVTILTWAQLARPRSTQTAPGISVVHVPSILPWDRDFARAPAVANSLVCVAAGAAAARAIGKRWDAVYATGIVPEGLTAALACAGTGKRFVIGTWLAGPIGNAARLERSIAKGTLLKMLSRASAIAVSTEEMRREMVAAGFSPDLVRISTEGVDLERFRPPTGEQRAAARTAFGLEEGTNAMCYAGRFDPRQKRVDLLLQGWANARPEGWRLLVAGKGPGLAAVEAAAAGSPSVRVIPWQSDVLPLFHACDAFALPTNFEGTGRSGLEALATGLPGLLSATRGYRLMDPGGAILTENTVEDWTTAIRTITSDDALRSKLSAEAVAWIRANYDAAGTVERLEAMIFGDKR